MPLDDLQQPNVGTPTFAKGNTSRRKAWAIVTTIAFSAFWLVGAFMVAGLSTGDGVHWSQPVLVILGLGVGIYGRREVERE
jgi:hypothetical protein